MDRKTALLSTFLLALGLCLTSVSASALDDNWPAFRGAEATSQAADDPRLPVNWSATENVVWKTPLPGVAWSSLVGGGNRVYLTTVVSEGAIEEPKQGLYGDGNRLQPPPGLHHFKVLAVDAESGQVVWDKTVLSMEPEFPRHIKNTYA